MDVVNDVKDDNDIASVHILDENNTTNSNEAIENEDIDDDSE